MGRGGHENPVGAWLSHTLSQRAGSSAPASGERCQLPRTRWHTGLRPLPPLWPWSGRGPSTCSLRLCCPPYSSDYGSAGAPPPHTHSHRRPSPARSSAVRGHSPLWNHGIPQAWGEQLRLQRCGFQDHQVVPQLQMRVPIPDARPVCCNPRGLPSSSLPCRVNHV